jgi:MoxR-like ATPase
MLYAQLLREKVGDLLAQAGDLRASLGALRGQADEFFSRDFLLPRPILAAITSERPALLLVDEVDRSDEEFEAFLLEVLSDYQVSIPELGTIRARHVPRVILTSNDTRELSDALRRRCLYLYVDFPSFDDEVRIVETRVPGLSEELSRRVVTFVHKVRKANVKRAPGVAEVVDWARALAAVGASSLGGDVLRRTLGALIKNREDLDRVLGDPGRYR